MKDQRPYSIAIGPHAGLLDQSSNAIAIGAQAGQTKQKDYAISMELVGSKRSR